MRQKFVGQPGLSGEGALPRSERDVGQYFFARDGTLFPMGLLEGPVEGPVEGPEIAFLRWLWRELSRGVNFISRATIASEFVVSFGLWPSDILVLILFDEDRRLGFVEGCKKSEVK